MGLLRPLPAQPACEHIATAGRGQSRIAGAVDPGQVVDCCDHGARAFQHHTGLGLGSEVLGAEQPLVLDLRGVAMGQACGLQGVGRQEGALLSLGAL